MTHPDIVQRLRAMAEATEKSRGRCEAAFCIETEAATEITTLRQQLAEALAELERRDANETRNCLNWGPCSRHDGRMLDGDPTLTPGGNHG